MKRLAILILAATVSTPALACSGPAHKLFEDVAPSAKNILVFQIESLGLEPESFDALEMHKIKAKIRVLKKYRDAGQDFQWLTYTNTICDGRRLDVGDVYLIATNSVEPLIELAHSDQAILHLSGGYFPFNPDYLLRDSPTLKGLAAALNGTGDFKLSTPATTLLMERGLPPPDVRPPAGMCLTLVPCHQLPLSTLRPER
jgi:hypothetical protein